jgi:hypothetical protein
MKPGTEKWLVWGAVFIAVLHLQPDSNLEPSGAVTGERV